MIIPGDFRYKITIQSRVLSRDSFGSAVETFSDLHYLRASIKMLSGNKGIENAEIFSPQTIQFITYFRSGIDETCRILYNAKKYRIVSIAEIQFREGLQINGELINE